MPAPVQLVLKKAKTATIRLAKPHTIPQMTATAPSLSALSVAVDMSVISNWEFELFFRERDR
jgi:hypothetical protein